MREASANNVAQARRWLAGNPAVFILPCRDASVAVLDPNVKIGLGSLGALRDICSRSRLLLGAISKVPSASFATKSLS
jgi:hypothetical protein